METIHLLGNENITEEEARNKGMFSNNKPIRLFMVSKSGNEIQSFIAYAVTEKQHTVVGYNFGTSLAERVSWSKLQYFAKKGLIVGWELDNKGDGVIKPVWGSHKDGVSSLVHCDDNATYYGVALSCVNCFLSGGVPYAEFDAYGIEECYVGLVQRLYQFESKYCSNGGGFHITSGRNFGMITAPVATWVQFFKETPNEARIAVQLGNLRRKGYMQWMSERSFCSKNICDEVEKVIKPFERKLKVVGK